MNAAFSRHHRPEGRVEISSSPYCFPELLMVKAAGFANPLSTSRSPSIMFWVWQAGPLRGERWQTTFAAPRATSGYVETLVKKNPTSGRRAAFTSRCTMHLKYAVWKINGGIIISWLFVTPHLPTLPEMSDMVTNWPPIGGFCFLSALASFIPV